MLRCGVLASGLQLGRFSRWDLFSFNQQGAVCRG
jgi:hypothetical protein